MFSMTYTGVLIMLASFVAKYFHGSIDQTTLQNTLTDIGQIVGALVALYGRYRAGGLSIFGFRKDQ